MYIPCCFFKKKIIPETKLDLKHERASFHFLFTDIYSWDLFQVAAASPGVVASMVLMLCVCRRFQLVFLNWPSDIYVTVIQKESEYLSQQPCAFVIALIGAHKYLVFHGNTQQTLGAL